MKIIFINPSSKLGGAERCLIDNIIAVKQQVPVAIIYVIIIAASSGEIAEELELLSVETILLPLPIQVARLGDSGKGKISSLLNLGRLIFANKDVKSFRDRLSKIIVDIDPDLIHSNGLKSHLLSANLKISKPIVWHLHDFISSRLLAKVLLKFAIGSCDLAIANSEATKKDWVGIFPELPVELVYNAVDIDRFKLNPDLKLVVDDNLPSVKVGLVATYARWKGQDMFLQSIVQISQHYSHLKSQVKFYIVGGAIYETERSQYSRSELIQLARDLKISDWIEFIDFRPDIEVVYNFLDIVVHASTQPEPFGRTIVEAMACERAVIVSKAGGAAELFTDGVDALGVVPGDPIALAGAMLELINDPARRVAMGKAGRKTVIERFNLDRLGRELMSVYLKLFKSCN